MGGFDTDTNSQFDGLFLVLFRPSNIHMFLVPTLTDFWRFSNIVVVLKRDDQKCLGIIYKPMPHNIPRHVGLEVEDEEKNKK